LSIGGHLVELLGQVMWPAPRLKYRWNLGDGIIEVFTIPSQYVPYAVQWALK